MLIATVAWHPKFYRLKAKQRIEIVTGSLRSAGHKILAVSSGLRLDGVKAAGVVTDSGLYCFPIGRFGRSTNIIAAEYAKFSIALLPPELSHEKSTSLHDLAEELHLPSKYYLSRLNFEQSWPRPLGVLQLLICRHREAIYPENVRDILPGERYELRATDVREIVAFSDVLIQALALFVKSSRSHFEDSPDTP